MEAFQQQGFSVLNDFYTKNEIKELINVLSGETDDRPTFRRSKELFAIRQVLKEFPSLGALIFNSKLKQLISENFGDHYFVSKSIYFDKPGNSNWFVAYHQDLTISVNKKVMLPGYGPYTQKQDQFAVQPPVEVLQNNFTIRIHLDHTDETNGALRVIPGSHLEGIRRMEQVTNLNDEVLCSVSEGGIMFMHPLLFHASGKSTGTRSRRVLHIELSNHELPEALNWSERFEYH